VDATLTILWRIWRTPAYVPLIMVGAGAAFLAGRMAEALLGGPEGFAAEVRAGSLLFAGALVLSLSEPLEVGRDARIGGLMLRVARGGGFALVRRWLAVTVATLPAVGVAALAGGGWPAQPVTLLLQLAVLAAAGLALGSLMDRRLLVPALWALLVLAHVGPWLQTQWAPLAWVLPSLGHLQEPQGWLHGLAWAAGALFLARARLGQVVGTPG